MPHKSPDSKRSPAPGCSPSRPRTLAPIDANVLRDIVHSPKLVPMPPQAPRPRQRPRPHRLAQLNAGAPVKPPMVAATGSGVAIHTTPMVILARPPEVPRPLQQQQLAYRRRRLRSAPARMESVGTVAEVRTSGCRLLHHQREHDEHNEGRADGDDGGAASVSCSTLHTHSAPALSTLVAELAATRAAASLHSVQLGVAP